MSDDLLERVRARARDNAFWRYLGVEVAEASEGRVRLLVRARDEIRNAPGASTRKGASCDAGGRWRSGRPPSPTRPASCSRWGAQPT